MTTAQIEEGLRLCHEAAANPRYAEASAAFHAKKHYAEALTELQALRRAGSDAGRPAVTALRDLLDALWFGRVTLDEARLMVPAAASEVVALDAAAPPAPMTLERAVAVLNERRHRKRSDWKIYTGKYQTKQWAVTEDDDALTPFEAVALAEKYLRERDAPGEAQEVRDGR